MRRRRSSPLGLLLLLASCAPAPRDEQPRVAQVEIEGRTAPPSEVTPSAPAAEPLPPPAPPVAWESSRPRAEQRARSERRMLIAYLHADWTVAALEMERDAWTDPEVRRAMVSVVALRADVTVDGEASNRELAHFASPGIPAVIAYSHDGRELARHVGKLDAAGLRAFLADRARQSL